MFLQFIAERSGVFGCLSVNFRRHFTQRCFNFFRRPIFSYFAWIKNLRIRFKKLVKPLKLVVINRSAAHKMGNNEQPIGVFNRIKRGWPTVLRQHRFVKYTPPVPIAIVKNSENFKRSLFIKRYNHLSPALF